MQVLKTRCGTYLTDDELLYRKELVIDAVVCPITSELLSIEKGEILFVNGTDYFISENGIDKLMNIFGEEYIKERIITYETPINRE